MYAYTTDNPVEVEIESGRPLSERLKYEIIIISVSDVHIALGFLRGELALLVVSRSEKDAKHQID